MKRLSGLPSTKVLVMSEQYPDSMRPISMIMDLARPRMVVVGTAWGSALLPPAATIVSKLGDSAPALKPPQLTPNAGAN